MMLSAAVTEKRSLDSDTTPKVSTILFLDFLPVFLQISSSPTVPLLLFSSLELLFFILIAVPFDVCVW